MTSTPGNGARSYIGNSVAVNFGLGGWRYRVWGEKIPPGKGEHFTIVESIFVTNAVIDQWIGVICSWIFNRYNKRKCNIFVYQACIFEHPSLYRTCHAKVMETDLKPNFFFENSVRTYYCIWRSYQFSWKRTPILVEKEGAFPNMLSPLFPVNDYVTNFDNSV